MTGIRFHDRRDAFLWRGEKNARVAARKFLVDNRHIEISDGDIALLIEVVYPPIAAGVLSKAMLVIRDLGDRAHYSRTVEALDLMRVRWTGGWARSRP